MNLHIGKTTLITAIAASALILAACGDKEAAQTSQTSGDQGTAAGASSPLDAYVLQTKPEGAVGVMEARNVARPGEPIVVTGQIGAAMDPFSKELASFVLGDEKIMYCDEMEEDHCPTPWDACCEDPAKVRRGRASVQILADGAPVPATLKGVNGMAELDKVVVAGIVDPASTPDNLIINATGIYADQQE